VGDSTGRFQTIWLPLNEGYAGAVNQILNAATTEYIAYLDNDAEITTQGWDETLCGYLDRFHEIGMIFPGGGAYQIDRGAYTEVQWGVGFCWVLSRLCMSEKGLFDAAIGHQNECDYAMRVRMAGYKCAAAPEVSVQHMATSTNDPASNERIAKGVREFVDKWCKYFCGKNINYHSANVLRWEDWPPNALYMEEYWKLRDPSLNVSPQVVTMDGREYDLIRVPRFKDFYRGRII
jgi:GT2 family glycosyltransferase